MDLRPMIDKYYGKYIVMTGKPEVVLFAYETLYDAERAKEWAEAEGYDEPFICHCVYGEMAIPPADAARLYRAVMEL